MVEPRVQDASPAGLRSSCRRCDAELHRATYEVRLSGTAAYHAVSMTFLEHAILLEGDDARTARSASATLVQGHWWRTLAVTGSLAGAGIAAAAIAAALLVQLIPSALVAINVVSSLVYIVLIPYVAVGLTLLYHDLNAARTPQD